MNRIITILALLSAAFSATVAAQSDFDESKATVSPLQVDNRIHDFGTIREADGIVEHTFLFRNTSSRPVVILRARTGCTCVKAYPPKRPIAPGATAKVRVTFNPNYRPGHFSKEIAIICDSSRYNRIWIRGDVEAMKHPIPENYNYAYGQGLYLNFRRMIFATVPAGTSKVMKLRLANDSDRTMRLTFECPDSQGLDILIPSGFILPPKGEDIMPITITVDKPFKGEKRFQVYPVVNGKRLPESIEVLVNGQIK